MGTNAKGLSTFEKDVLYMMVLTSLSLTKPILARGTSKMFTNANRSMSCKIEALKRTNYILAAIGDRL